MCYIVGRNWRKDHTHEPSNINDELKAVLTPDVTKTEKIQDDPNWHDTQLDSYVERADHTDANPAAELDHRTRTGFQWIFNPLKKEGDL